MKLKGMNPALFASILLTGLRVVLGIFWLLQLTWKPPPTFACPEGFCLWVGLEVQYPVIPLYGEFVKAVIQPNIILFGWITTIVEVLIGLSLLFGLFTRLGALVDAQPGQLYAVECHRTRGDRVLGVARNGVGQRRLA